MRGERAEDVGPDRLEAALRVREPGAEAGLEQEVVGAGDELPLGAPDHGRLAVQPAADGEVAVAGQQRGDQGRNASRPVDRSTSM